MAEDAFISHQHPIKILSYTTKFFWLLVIPLVRGLISMQWDFQTWVEGAWIDIIVLLLIFLFAYTRWYNITFKINPSSFSLYSGIYIKGENTIDFSKITSFSVEKNYFLNLINANRLIIETNCGSGRKSDILITVKINDADRFIDILEDYNYTNELRITYKPKKTHLLIFSLIFSNTLSGVILIATLIYQSGKMAGQELESRLIYTVNEITKKLSKNLPPAAVLLSLIIIGGWLLSFILNMLRYWNFSASRKGKVLTIKSGFFSKYINEINLSKVNYADYRQNLLTMLFRVSSLHIHCTGYGKGKRQIAVLIPITTRHEIASSTKMLLPDLSTPDISIRPGPHQVQRFMFFPVIFLLVIPIISLIFIKFLTSWMDMILFVTIMIEIPVIWALIVKIVSNYTTGIGSDENYIKASYCCLYSFHSVVIPKQKISTIIISQTIFQKATNDCTLIFYTHAEHTKKHTVRNLPLEECNKFLKEIGYSVPAC